jgi:Asp-tRNA(Asn)/Glu-tRNA(Gln) amidotransferase A subunit family amidase
MISPVYYHSAYKTKEGRNELALQADYTQLWNVLSYPAGVVPVTEVLEGEDRAENYQDGFNDVLTKRLRESISDSVGMPLCIQVATPKWKDEECLAIISVLERIINYHKEVDVK